MPSPPSPLYHVQGGGVPLPPLVTKENKICSAGALLPLLMLLLMLVLLLLLLLPLLMLLLKLLLKLLLELLLKLQDNAPRGGRNRP